MIDLSRAEVVLADILMEHEALLDEARGFGLRTAALPRGLMPVKEAQKVVADMGANLEKLDKFYNGLMFGTREVPKELAGEFDALLTKAKKAREKCELDVKKAREALEKHEDLLVGEAFQEAFEAVRIAIVDFDPADDVDLDFKTELFLDKEPSYAVGVVLIKRGGQVPFKVHVGYRAEDDFFYGNIEVPARYKTFQNVVKKNGRTKLPAFVRELTEQLKALADAQAPGLFKSRKKVELTLVDPEVVRAELKKAADVHLAAAFGSGKTETNLVVSVDSSGTSATGRLSWDGWGWDQELNSLADAESKFRHYEGRRARLAEKFQAPLANGQVWEAAPRPGPWSYKIGIWSAYGYHSPQIFSTIEQLKAVWPAEWDYKPTLTAVRERARQYAIPVDPKSRDVRSLVDAIRRKTKPPKGFRVASSPVDVTFTLVGKVKKGAVERVADAFLSRQAGADSFGVYSPGKDVRQAFRDAVSNAQHDRGHGGYTGTIAEKHSYKVRREEPFVWNGRWPMPEDMRRFLEQDDRAGSPCDDKWGPACAVPVSEEKVLAKEDVVVTVEARDEAEARRKGILLIKAKGRVPPKATILVEVPEGTKGLTLENKGARVSTWSVKGVRKQSIVGEITGWYFYGTASS